MIRPILFLFLLLGSVFGGETSGKKKTICLNMIVKNESQIMARCLSSVKGLIDYWVIVDTGSTDGTQQTIRELLKGIPGELHERPWVNFGHNRNEALALAKKKADFCLFIDADEQLIFSKDFKLPDLDLDCYVMRINQAGGHDYFRISLVDNRLDWKWVGALHELIQCPTAKTHAILEGVYNLSDTMLGARSKDPDKYLKDAQLLEKELKKNPMDLRSLFYLGMSYTNAKRYGPAIESLAKRATLGGFEEEVFFSKFIIASLQDEMGKPAEVVIKSYLDAYECRPTRAEPLFYLGNYYLRAKNYQKAYEIFKRAVSIALPKDILFVSHWIYEWGALFDFAKACFELGKYEEVVKVYEKLLLSKKLPEPFQEEVRKNLPLIKILTSQS